MKKLIILTAVMMLTGSAVGCRCNNSLWRGASCNPCGQTATFGDFGTVQESCDSCGTPQGIAPPYSSIGPQ